MIIVLRDRWRKGFWTNTIKRVKSLLTLSSTTTDGVVTVTGPRTYSNHAFYGRGGPGVVFQRGRTCEQQYRYYCLRPRQIMTILCKRGLLAAKTRGRYYFSSAVVLTQWRLCGSSLPLGAASVFMRTKTIEISSACCATENAWFSYYTLVIYTARRSRRICPWRKTNTWKYV